MEAGLSVATDKEGRDYCVVVVKGTFAIGDDGQATLAQEQEPLVYADVHYGDPAETSMKYECDFARFKPQADIIVNGHAYSPTGKPVEAVDVALEVGTLKKQIRVVGDRHWHKRLFGFRVSAPTPFIKMPLVYERAFGGSDHSHEQPQNHGTELRNPLGVGFCKNSDAKIIKGTPLPNLEHLDYPIRKWSDTPPPIGFGILGRNWEPRIKHAGTYDEQWQNERFPFLPEDFADLYFQSAPSDQQLPYLKGGEVVRCINMTPEGRFEFTVPTVEFSVEFQFQDREERVDPNLDTLIIEPDQQRLLLVWRAAIPVGPKLHALREVYVGHPPQPRPVRVDKPYFESLAEFIAWKKELDIS
jgi:hypothetical protein